MIPYIIGAGIALMILERIIPDQKLPAVRGWWTRVIVVNILQLGVVLIAERTWNTWFGVSLLTLRDSLTAPAAALVVYLTLTFVFYWWHRWRHDVNFLWLTCHQLHHSPARIETITSFYKHPTELVINGIIIAAVNFGLFGLDAQGAAWVTLYTALGEFFYHMNIRTPHWLGYFFQRPEMHRIHHKRGFHYNNFADLPVWDMLFGTFENPRESNAPCGFRPERELRFVDMLRCRNVNNPFPPAGDGSPAP